MSVSGIVDPLTDRLFERGFITEADIELARTIQAETGGEIGWIIASMGRLNRIQLYSTISEVTGLPFVTDPERLRSHADINLLYRVNYDELIQYQFMPFSMEDGVLTIATSQPGNAAMHAFCRNRFGCRLVAELLVTDLDITRMTARTYRTRLAQDAVLKLFKRSPEQSARKVFTQTQVWLFGGLLLGAIAWLALYPVPAFVSIMVFLQLSFVLSISMKVVLSIAGARNEISQPISPQEVAALDDADLPVYTVLVPVFKEPEVVHQLIEGIKNIDYPQHKLDIILLLEENDPETLKAAMKAQPPSNWRLIVVPECQPKTKPKACNIGLYFARGEYLVIFDAEDIPEPNQLKSSIVAFKKNGPEYVCFQAALNYFNANENFLTRMFCLEYSYWFDYLVPGLDRLQLPIPLGGTSNHFDVAKLRRLGGWDPFNTTEDCDLGLRATAEGMKVGFINSTTFEEANTNLGNWIRQRSRWCKGYMQSYLVFIRHPVALVRTIGVKNFLAFNLFVGGTVMTFLATPPLWILSLSWLFFQGRFENPLPDWLLVITLVNLIIGNLLGIYLNMLAVFVRKNYRLLPFALLNPIYWVLHSIAAYKALGQLFTKPFYWEKTQHGISNLSSPARAPK
jgi:cellulose synthase/poly-beta-1,6-N-acetylglucosamine synthase-like glycosyltransferase